MHGGDALHAAIQDNCHLSFARRVCPKRVYTETCRAAQSGPVGVVFIFFTSPDWPHPHRPHLGLGPPIDPDLVAVGRLLGAGLTIRRVFDLNEGGSWVRWGFG